MSSNDTPHPAIGRLAALRASQPPPTDADGIMLPDTRDQLREAAEVWAEDLGPGSLTQKIVDLCRSHERADTVIADLRAELAAARDATGPDLGTYAEACAITNAAAARLSTGQRRQEPGPSAPPAGGPRR